MARTNDLTMRIVIAWKPAWDDLSFAQAMQALKSKNKKLVTPKPKLPSVYVAPVRGMGGWIGGRRFLLQPRAPFRPSSH